MFPELPDELTAELEVILPLWTRKRPEHQGPERLAWSLRLIVGYEADRGALVRCLCEQVRLALPVVGRHEHRPRQALEIVEAWVCSQDKRRRRAEENRLRRVIQDLRRYDGTLAQRTRPGERWAVAAALQVALSTYAPENALVVPQLVLSALTLVEPSYAPPELMKRPVEQLAGVLFGWRWPSVTRLPDEPCEPALLVAWDWLSERVEARATLSTAELLRAICCRRALLARLPEASGRSEIEQRLLHTLAERIALGGQREALIEGVVHLMGASPGVR